MGNKKFLISHCGIYNFDKPIDEQYDGLSEVYKLQKYPFLWARNCDFSKKRYYDYIIIHGHTPVYSLGLVDNVKIPYVNKSADEIISINIDTGCVYGYALSAIIIDSDGEITFESIDCAD
jgi:serine/threonine protein phosphatase 1